MLFSSPMPEHRPYKKTVTKPMTYYAYLCQSWMPSHLCALELCSKCPIEVNAQMLVLMQMQCRNYYCYFSCLCFYVNRTYINVVKLHLVKVLTNLIFLHLIMVRDVLFTSHWICPWRSIAVEHNILNLSACFTIFKLSLNSFISQKYISG